MIDSSEQTIKGGEFLIRESNANSTFIPNEFSEEHKMMASMADEFLETEVFPFLDQIDSMQEGLMVSILDKAGELGLLGITVPEEYGGFGKGMESILLFN